MGGPHRQGALSRPCHRLPIRCVALCGLQRVHHGAGRAPRAGRFATRRSHKIVSRHGPRSRPSPSPLFPYRRHLARYPAGPGGRSGRASCGHLPGRRGMARPPTATPRLLLPRGPPGPRRRAPRAPRLARLPPRLFCVSPATAPPRPQRVRQHRQPRPHHMGGPPHGHRHPPLPIPPKRYVLPPLHHARLRGPHPLVPARPAHPRPLPSVACGPTLSEVPCLAPLYAHCLGHPRPLGGRAVHTGCGWLPGPPHHRNLHCWSSRSHLHATQGCPAAQRSASCASPSPTLRRRSHYRSPT